MAEGDNTYSVEWEEVDGIEGRCIFSRLKKSQLDTHCKKEKKINGYHDNFVSYKNALEIAKSNKKTSEAVDTILGDVGQVRLQRYFDSVVYIEVRQKSLCPCFCPCFCPCPKIFCGTGFVILSDALHVITNYHVAFGKDTGNLVDAEAIQVVFFHDGVKDPVVCPVIELTPYRSEDTQDEMLEGDLQHLDYIILEVNPNGVTSRGACRRGEIEVKAQTMHKFAWEETARIQGMHAGLSLSYIVKNIFLVCIGHPHGAPKQMSFGKLITDPDELFREWVSHGENRVSVDHDCATCGGSSGSPVFAFLLQKNDDDDDDDDGLEVNGVSDMSKPYFLHYAGSASSGNAMSFQSIAPSVRESYQETIVQDGAVGGSEVILS